MMKLATTAAMVEASQTLVDSRACPCRPWTPSFEFNVETALWYDPADPGREVYHRLTIAVLPGFNGKDSQQFSSGYPDGHSPDFGPVVAQVRAAYGVFGCRRGRTPSDLILDDLVTSRPSRTRGADSAFGVWKPYICLESVHLSVLILTPRNLTTSDSGTSRYRERL